MEDLTPHTFMFGPMKNFTNGQLVVCDVGDGQEYTGVVKGKDNMQIPERGSIYFISYIVEFSAMSKAKFSEKYPSWDWDCILLAESCLRKAEDKHDE